MKVKKESLLLGRYRLIRKIGEGGTGEVWKGEDREGGMVAVKFLKKGRGLSMPELMREFGILHRFNHPDIVKVLDAGRREDGTPFFVMEFVEGERVDRFIERERRFLKEVVVRTLRAISAIHRGGIVHGDLKPENIVVRSGEDGHLSLKILDFGLSGFRGKGGRGLRGTLSYMAPEVLKGMAPTPASDIYSSGIIIHELLTGRNPFSGEDLASLLSSRLRGEVAPPSSDEVRDFPSFPNLMGRFLSPVEERRFGSAEEALSFISLYEGGDETLAGVEVEGVFFEGRKGEMRRLRSLLQDIRKGRRRVVFIYGEGGMGKTTLLKRFEPLCAVKRIKWIALSGRGSPLEEIVKDSEGIVEPTLAGAGEYLKGVLRRSPIIIKGEDVERWGEGERGDLKDLITYFNEGEIGPVFIITGGGEPFHAFRSTLLEGIEGEDVVDLPLMPLNLKAVKDILLHLIHGYPGLDTLAGEVLSVTQGNPGRVEELLKRLMEEKGIEFSGGKGRVNEIKVWSAIKGYRSSSLISSCRERLEGVIASETGEGLLKGVAEILREASEIAPEGAVKILEGSLEHVKGREAEGSEGLVRLLKVGGEIYLRAGEVEKGASLFLQGADMAQRLREGAKGRDLHLLQGELLKRGGEAYVTLSKFEEAFGLFDAALRIFEDVRDEGEVLGLLLPWSWGLMLSAKYVEGLALIERGYEITRRRGDKGSLARLLRTEGTILLMKGEGRRSIPLFEKSRRFFEEAGDERGMADSLMSMGNALRTMGRLKAAERAYRKALRINLKEKDYTNAAKAYNNLGIVKYLRGDWRGSIDFWDSFGEVMKRLGGRSELVYWANNTGVVLRDSGLIEKARRRFEEGILLAEELGMKRYLSMLYGNLGETMLLGGKEEGLSLYRKCESLAEEAGAKDEIIEVKRRMAEYHLSIKYPERANEAVREGLDLAVSEKNRGEEGNLRFIWGCIKLEEGDREGAEREFRLAEELKKGERGGFEYARMELLMARSLLNAGLLERARSAGERALETFERLGSEIYAGKGRDLLNSIKERFSRIEGADRRESILLEFISALSGTLDVELLLRKILERAIEVTGAERGFVIIFDEERKPIFRAARGIEDKDASGERHLLSTTVVREVLEKGRPVAVTDTGEEKDYRDRESIVALNLKSILGFPIQMKGKRLGVIYLDSRNVQETLLGGEYSLLESLASYAGIALENATLYEDIKRKSSLMATMAHELRSPLTAVVSMVDLILSESDRPSPQVVEYLNMIKRQGIRLGRLVNDILELAKMEAEKVEYRMERLSIEEVIDFSIASTAPLFMMKAIEVRKRIHPDLPGIFGDADRMSQVLINLLSNAIKFTPPTGEIEVFAAVAEKEGRMALHRPLLKQVWGEEGKIHLDEGRSILVKVKDSGPGIPPDQIPELFREFSQVGDREKKKEGTGLGLAISRKIVTDHGGRIWAQNSPEGGAELCFLLPALRG